MLVYASVQTATSRYLSLSRGVLISFHRDSFAPSPFSARASAIRSRTCGRQRLAFLAASATGGARKPNPSEGAEAATAASHRIAKARAAVKPAVGGLPSSVTVQRKSAAPRHLPQRGRLRRLPPQSIYFPSASTLNHRKNGLSISVEHRLSSV